MLIGAATFVLILIALLAVPVTLRFRVHWRETLQDDVRLIWGFGLVRVRIPLKKEAAAPQERDQERRRARERRAPPKRKANVLGALRVRSFRRRMMRFAGDLWRSVQKKDVRLRLRVGLDDPAETGWLWAVVGPIAAFAAMLRDISIRLEPEFLEPTFELDTSGTIRLIPIYAIALTLLLMLSPAFWRGMRRLRRAGS
jgi:hypothetical protein